MINLRWLSAVVIAVSIASVNSRAAEPVRIKPFTLPNEFGQSWTLPDAKRSPLVVVVFTSTGCPVNTAYMPTLRKLHDEYFPKGVTFVAINSLPVEDIKAVSAHARKHRQQFPALKDAEQKVAEQFQTDYVPEVFVLDAERIIRYRGRIDDQFGVGFSRPKPTRRDLAIALDELLAGKPVSVAQTEVEGCSLGRGVVVKVEKPTYTYARDVAKIAQAKCQECHRPGQVGPILLTSAAQFAAQAPTVRRVVQSNRMPPWHADPKYGHFSNDRRLSDGEKEILLSWIDQGCPEGDPRDLPKPRVFADGWRIGKPDVVLTMPKPFEVPANAPEGGVPYQYFRIPTNFDRDMWVQAAEVTPGEREIVHHVAVFIIQPGEKDRSQMSAQNLLVAYVPGDTPSAFAPGQAKKVPKGATLLLQVHYTPDGAARSDRSSVGLIFAKEAPKYEVRSHAIMNNQFTIPPGAEDFEVKAQATFDREVSIVNLFPHMHLRGKAFQFVAVLPDGKRETLLSVPCYEFNWQSNYRLAKPVTLPAGSQIECRAWYDNSVSNKNNPDATKQVRWGDQSWSEMMVGFVDYVQEAR